MEYFIFIAALLVAVWILICGETPQERILKKMLDTYQMELRANIPKGESQILPLLKELEKKKQKEMQHGNH